MEHAWSCARKSIHDNEKVRELSMFESLARLGYLLTLPGLLLSYFTILTIIVQL
jgi:hypothetical protein